MSLLALNYAVHKQLSGHVSARIVKELEVGRSLRRVAIRFDISLMVVSRIWTRFRENGRYTGRPKIRHCMTTPMDDRALQPRTYCLTFDGVLVCIYLTNHTKYDK